MTDKTIFGYSWDQIQAMQQGSYKGRPITGDMPTVKELLEKDKQLLAENGEQWLMDQQFNGTLDRLRKAEILS